MENVFTTSSKSKGKVSNYHEQFQDCLMEIIMHTPSPETVSTPSYVYQNKVLLEKISLDM